MIRRIIQMHTAVLGCAGLALLVAPRPILASLAITEPSLGTVSLTRVIAALLVIVAAAVLSVSHLESPARAAALRVIGIAYTIGALLLIAQEIAIWNTVGGALVVGVAAIAAVAFLGAARAERRYRVAGA